MSIIDTIKNAVGLVQKLDNIPLLKMILDLQQQAFETVEQLKQKDERIEHLEHALSFKDNLVVKNQAYFQVKQSKEIDGPFCTKCFDIDHRTCRLLATDNEPNVYCPNCKSEVASKPLFDRLRPEVELERQRYRCNDSDGYDPLRVG